MLTKQLLKFRKRLGKINPKFIDETDKEVLKNTDDIIQCCKNSIGNEFLVLNENLHAVAFGADYAPGLKKLATEKLEFQKDSSESEDFRWQAFLESQQIRNKQLSTINTITEFQTQVSKNISSSPQDLLAKLYCDLPKYRKILAFKNIDKIWLIRRYNLAQVQGLLIHTTKISFSLTELNLAEKRFLFRQLKFFGLMSVLTPCTDNKKFSFEIEGPLTIFSNKQIYGTNIANFFPHMLRYKNWSVTATIELSKKKYTLELNQKSNLISHYKDQPLTYIPEELTIIAKTFQQKDSNWALDFTGQFVDIGRKSYCFSDIMLENKKTSQKKIFIELFHKWHKSQLEHRLSSLDATLSKKNDLNELDFEFKIGISRSLLKNKQYASIINKSNWFKEHGFSFTEFPTTKNLLNIVNK